MIYSVLLVIVVIIILAFYLAKKEGKPLSIELSKATLSIAAVFLGVFLAQYYSNLYNVERDKLHVIKLLEVSHLELSNFNMWLQAIPDNYSKAKHEIPGYEPKDLFKDNPIELPFIVKTTLNDTNIIRTMHPQSITSILAALENSKVMLLSFNNKDFSEENLKNSIEIAAHHLTTLTKYVRFETSYQLGEISEEELFDLHRSVIKNIETKPVGSLIKIK
ncbi:hypothetical protein Q3O60_00615 [Alkalimonas collagenimarina]|uniref:Uncharacterized protein n=1 Tax=Alkalimonas collagenimarina TaxID=400390 RepID=A0ABT9GUG0_9GAMM|nr:hypothetical protein [Alkalimonas collagenimarina]MDP4534696.1 hypothetical protein [Alkalimonas collagenimarina]